MDTEKKLKFPKPDTRARRIMQIAAGYARVGEVGTPVLFALTVDGDLFYGYGAPERPFTWEMLPPIPAAEPEA